MRTFDPRQYWRDHGADIARAASSNDQLRAEEQLVRVLARIKHPRSILEIGPGKGRITTILRSLWPDAAYTAVEIGREQAGFVAMLWPESNVINLPIQDWEPPGVEQFDLVITSEVLMHIPPDEVGPVIEKLLRCTRRHLVLLEWMPLSWELAQPVGEHNWPHDYLSYLGGAMVWRTDRQGIFLVDMMDRKREYL
jgi:phospholipid N-methyltransferase